MTKKRALNLIFMALVCAESEREEFINACSNGACPREVRRAKEQIKGWRKIRGQQTRLEAMISDPNLKSMTISEIKIWAADKIAEAV